MNLRNALAALSCAALSTFASAAPFTYQGSLHDNGVPANGQYDLIFRLFSVASGGTQLGTQVVRENTPVVDGLFSVEIDFGDDLFLTSPRFLQVEVRPGASGGFFDILAPRSPINPAPAAQHAATSDTINAPAVISSTADQDTLAIALADPSPSDDSSALRVTRGSVDSPSILSQVDGRIAEFESADAPIGILATADIFPIAGIVDQNSNPFFAGALYGEVRSVGINGHAAVIAINTDAGTSVQLARGNNAAEFNGDVRVDGNIIRSYTSSSEDLATPIAYGFININGTIANGTPNISSVFNSSSMRYEIEIDDNFYIFSSYVTIVTPTGNDVSARTSSVSGRLIVQFESTSSQSPVQSSFQFVTFKPNGAALVDGQRRRQIQPLNTPYTDTDLNPNPINPQPRAPVEPQPAPPSIIKHD